VSKWDKKEVKDSQNNVLHKKKDAVYAIEFLMPHEFLFLLCNAINRLDTVIRLHNPDLTSEKANIYQWELSNG
jgi:hypothetical protein